MVGDHLATIVQLHWQWFELGESDVVKVQPQSMHSLGLSPSLDLSATMPMNAILLNMMEKPIYYRMAYAQNINCDLVFWGVI